VVAEDGHVYERRALEHWLSRKRTSPSTNEPMGNTMLPSLVAQQTINELVEQGISDTDTLINFLLDRGRLRSTRTGSPGPDLKGAEKDFTKAAGLARLPMHRKLAEFQLKVAHWMREGASIFGEVEQLQAECKGSGEEVMSWILDYGDAAKAAIIGPLLDARRMTQWQELQAGARVKVIDDSAELQRLCERAPPEVHVVLLSSASEPTGRRRCCCFWFCRGCCGVDPCVDTGRRGCRLE